MILITSTETLTTSQYLDADVYEDLSAEEIEVLKK